MVGECGLDVDGLVGKEEVFVGCSGYGEIFLVGGEAGFMVEEENEYECCKKCWCEVDEKVAGEVKKYSDEEKKFSVDGEGCGLHLIIWMVVVCVCF